MQAPLPGTGEDVERLVHRHREQIRQRHRLVPVLRRPGDLACDIAVACAVAVRAVDVHVGQELHVECDLPGAIAGRAAQRAGVVRERARLESTRLRRIGARIEPPQIVEHTAVGGDGGAHVRTDRRRVDHRDAVDSRRIERAHMFRQAFAGNLRSERGHKAFEHERGLAGTGDAGDHGETMFWHARIQGVHGVQRRGLDFQCAFVEYLVRGRLRAHDLQTLARKERSDERVRVAFDVTHRTLRDHSAAM